MITVERFGHIWTLSKRGTWLEGTPYNGIGVYSKVDKWFANVVSKHNIDNLGPYDDVEIAMEAAIKYYYCDNNKSTFISEDKTHSRYTK